LLRKRKQEDSKRKLNMKKCKDLPRKKKRKGSKKKRRHKKRKREED